jgi:carboxymethylenebutenolidase
MSSYDLEALWDAHCRCEFETRNVDATMDPMVAWLASSTDSM